MHEHRENNDNELDWNDRKDMAVEDADWPKDNNETLEQENAEKRAFLKALNENPQLIISTAGSSFDGIKVETYLDTISVDGIVGSSIPSAADAIATDLTGQRSIELAKKMERAKRIAWEELLWRAHVLGANGVLGVRYDIYMPYAGAFGASVTATAVKLTK